MTTVGQELDRVQSKLHDAGVLWTREELRRLWNDRYRQLCAETQAARRWRALDLPGRHAYTITAEWEDRHTTGPVRKPSRRGAYVDTTMLWEPGHVAGVPVGAAPGGLTQEWERAHLGATDRHMRVSFPRPHERVTRLHWHDRPLQPVAVREFDELTTAWWEQTGEPRWWTTGTGRVRSVELYEFRTDYQAAWDLRAALAGIPRHFITGSTRTYAVTITPEPIGSAWAYTTAGEAEALVGPKRRFAPRSAVTQDWELDLESSLRPGWVWVIDLIDQTPGLTHTVVHPWEFGAVGGPVVVNDPASPGARGQFPWERRSPTFGYEALVPNPDAPPVIPGLGVRCTAQATTGEFVTQVWEEDWLEGAAVLRAGALVASFTWEEWLGGILPTLGLGLLRRILSPARQYLAVTPDQNVYRGTGVPRDWRSSAEALLVLEVLLPDTALDEAAVPQLLPAQVLKYVRYGVLAAAFAKPSEGHQAILADHYGRRFASGIALLRRLADITHRDRVFVREMVEPDDRGRVPRVRLPAEFPAVW